MKDIEKLLESSGTHRPRRELHTDFTENIITHVQTHPRQVGWRERIGALFTMRFYTRPVLVAALIAVTLGVGGVSYAAANWSSIIAVFNGETKLSSGNRIVGVNATDCNYFSAPDKAPNSKENLYYEIRKDSTLTNEQVVDMILGVCQQNIFGHQLNDIVSFKDHPTYSGSAIMMVAAKTDTSITLQPDPRNPFLRDSGKSTTYTNLSPTLKAYNTEKREIPFSSIRVGDAVYAVANDPHLPAREIIDKDDYYSWSHPESITIETILKLPQPLGNQYLFDKHIGNDFVRTEPCDHGEKGFCRAYEFHTHMLPRH